MLKLLDPAENPLGSLLLGSWMAISAEDGLLLLLLLLVEQLGYLLKSREGLLLPLPSLLLMWRRAPMVLPQSSSSSSSRG
jgi:hypothetical protein